MTSAVICKVLIPRGSSPAKVYIPLFLGHGLAIRVSANPTCTKQNAYWFLNSPCIPDLCNWHPHLPITQTTNWSSPSNPSVHPLHPAYHHLSVRNCFGLLDKNDGYCNDLKKKRFFFSYIAWSAEGNHPRLVYWARHVIGPLDSWPFLSVKLFTRFPPLRVHRGSTLFPSSRQKERKTEEAIHILLLAHISLAIKRMHRTAISGAR